MSEPAFSGHRRYYWVHGACLDTRPIVRDHVCFRRNYYSHSTAVLRWPGIFDLEKSIHYALDLQTRCLPACEGTITGLMQLSGEGENDVKH